MAAGVEAMSDYVESVRTSTNTLPDWYPLANATDQEIECWLSSENLPVADMKRALPWLTEQYQFQAWVDGLRAARADYQLSEVFPGIAAIPLPPRRIEGRSV
jgi:hypothetical protein